MSVRWTSIRTSEELRTVNWKALTRRMVSSTERPTGRSLTVICLQTSTHSDRALGSTPG